jgi:hypothetical protein
MVASCSFEEDHETVESQRRLERLEATLADGRKD